LKLQIENDKWVVTTPLYAGSTQEVAKACGCIHEWLEAAPEVVGERPALDKCKNCCATRARYALRVEQEDSGARA
jgi:hypothetical protein